MDVAIVDDKPRRVEIDMMLGTKMREYINGDIVNNYGDGIQLRPGRGSNSSSYDKSYDQSVAGNLHYLNIFRRRKH